MMLNLQNQMKQSLKYYQLKKGNIYLNMDTYGDGGIDCKI